MTALVYVPVDAGALSLGGRLKLRSAIAAEGRTAPGRRQGAAQRLARRLLA